MDKQERMAGAVMAAMLSGSPVERDVSGAPPGTHDFDIETRDGRVIALEVTSTVDPESQATWALIARHEWVFPELVGFWGVSVVDPTLIRRLHRVIRDVLPVLEAAGIQSFDDDATFDEAQVAEAVEQLRDAGVRHGKKGGDRSPGVVWLSTHRVGATAPDDVAEEVEEVLHRPDNIDKLKRASASERHLWVWISKEPAISAMSFDMLPERVSKLPERIDVVWVAQGLLSGPDENRPTRLWRLDRAGWSDQTTQLRAV